MTFGLQYSSPQTMQRCDQSNDIVNEANSCSIQAATWRVERGSVVLPGLRQIATAQTRLDTLNLAA
jgi:hypothetical protein